MLAPRRVDSDAFIGTAEGAGKSGTGICPAGGSGESTSDQVVKKFDSGIMATLSNNRYKIIFAITILIVIIFVWRMREEILAALIKNVSTECKFNTLEKLSQDKDVLKYIADLDQAQIQGQAPAAPGKKSSRKSGGSTNSGATAPPNNSSANGSSSSISDYAECPQPRQASAQHQQSMMPPPAPRPAQQFPTKLSEEDAAEMQRRLEYSNFIRMQREQEAAQAQAHSQAQAQAQAQYAYSQQQMQQSYASQVPQQNTYIPLNADINVQGVDAPAPAPTPTPTPAPAPTPTPAPLANVDAGATSSTPSGAQLTTSTQP